MTPVLGLRLLCGTVCGLAGLLTVVTVGPGANGLTSTVSRLATEFGYCLLAPAAACLLPGWRGSSAGRVSVALNTIGVVLLLAPPARAWEASQELPQLFMERFGSETRTRHPYAEGPRQVPFALGELFRPASSGPVRHEERVVQGAAGNFTLTIFRPAYSHEAIPGLLVIHGETWPGGVGRELVALDGYLAARDYLVVGMSDPMAAGRDSETARQDVVSAIAFLKSNASELGLKPTHLALMGRSVAGHLPLLVAYTGRDPSIRGVISFYAPTDLAHFYAHTDPAPPAARAVLGTYLGGDTEPSLTTLDAISPVRHVKAAAPPTLLVHGLQDGVVPANHSEQLAARLKKADVRHVLIQLPWAKHACDQNFAGPCGQITTYAVERFLDSVMAPPSRQATAPRQTGVPREPLGFMRPGVG